MAGAAITVAVAFAGLIAVEADELDILVGLALLQHIGTGTDEFLHRLVLLFGRDDDRRRIVEGKQRGQRRIGLLQRDRDGRRIDRGDLVDEAGHLLAARGNLHPAAKRGDDIFRGHVGIVVELDAGPELDRIGFAVGADLRQAFGQKRRDVPALVKGVERFENVLRDDADEIGRRRHRIERRRLTDRRNVDDAALFLGKERRRQGDERSAEKECDQCFHVRAPV